MAELDAIVNIEPQGEIEKLYSEVVPAPAVDVDLFGEPVAPAKPEKISSRQASHRNVQYAAERGCDPFKELIGLGLEARARGDTAEAIKCFSVLIEYTHRRLAPDVQLLAQATVGPQGAAVTFAWQGPEV